MKDGGLLYFTFATPMRSGEIIKLINSGTKLF